MNEILSKEEIKRVIEVFSDPIKIIILFKIIKNPKISSKILKQELALLGTKIYYYIDDLEGFEKIKGKFHHSKLKKIQSKIPFIVSEEEMTLNHLKRKRYKLSSWCEDLLKQHKFYNISTDPLELKRWNSLVNINLSLALLMQKKRELENSTKEDFKEGARFDLNEHLNKALFLSEKKYNAVSDGIVNVLVTEKAGNLESDENVISKIINSSHTFIFGSMNW